MEGKKITIKVYLENQINIKYEFLYKFFGRQKNINSLKYDKMKEIT